jgi:3-keto-5-aminohexanoate cleavage enzyme
MVSTGGAMGMSIAERTTGLDAGPDMSSIEVGSLNFFADLFPTLPHEAEAIAKAATERGIGLEVEAFEIGHIDTAVEMQRAGILPDPLRIGIVLGVPGALAATHRNLVAAASAIPPEARWGVIAIGRHQTRMITLALLMGATSIRVGFEDNVYLRRGELAGSNAELVAQARRTSEALGRSVASIGDARRLLGLSASPGTQGALS